MPYLVKKGRVGRQIKPFIILLFLLVLVTSTNAIPDGGVNFYSFSTGSGVTATDSWGSNDGTYTDAFPSSLTVPSYNNTGNGATYSANFSAGANAGFVELYDFDLSDGTTFNF